MTWAAVLGAIALVILKLIDLFSKKASKGDQASDVGKDEDEKSGELSDAIRAKDDDNSSRILNDLSSDIQSRLRALRSKRSKGPDKL